jgi:PAS domain-containing protein
VGVRVEDSQPTREWWIERIHPDDLARHEDGRWIDLWEQGYLKRNSQGEVIEIIGCTTNITERKQAEQALQIGEERLQLAIEDRRQRSI